jgi:hypothetical protein
MESLLERIQELENRTRKVEGQLLRWRTLAFLLAIGGAALAYCLPGQAQVPLTNLAAPTTFTAPFVVKAANGMTLLEVKEFNDQASENSQDALLTLYRNGLPAVMYRTTGKVYKDAYDPKENFLNVVETWLYRYPKNATTGKLEPLPYLAASTALTRAGGSVVVFNEESSKPSMTPPFAARLTAKRGSGGSLVLYDNEGREAREIQPK